MAVYKFSTNSLKTPLIYSSWLAGNATYIPPFEPSGAYDSIATTTVGSGGASTITFSSIPSTYTHLQLRIMAKSSATAADYYDMQIRFNSDSGTNYARHSMFGNGSTTIASNNISATLMIVGQTPTNYSSWTGMFSGQVTDILDYTNTNKYKTVRSLTGHDQNSGTTTGTVGLFSGLWMSTTAISTITITSELSTSFVENSSFALYGIKGA